MRILLLVTVFALACLAAERKAVVPESGPKPVGPYSPGIWAGETLYVSGQGARDPQGNLPEGIEAQTKQTLENVKAVIEAAGLGMSDVVYTHVYVDNMANEPAVRQVYGSYFTDRTPASITVGVAKMPTGTPVEISAIAVKGGNAPRVYVGSQTSGSGLRGAVRSAKGDENNLALATVYYVKDAFDDAQKEVAALNKMTDGPAVQLIQVASLPGNGRIALTGVAAMSKADKKVYKSGSTTMCASAGETIYCAAQAGKGTEMGAQVNDAISRLETGLKALGADLSRAVANNVYMNRIEQFADMNKVYGERFPAPYPTRTTVQPQVPEDRLPLARIAVVAVR